MILCLSSFFGIPGTPILIYFSRFTRLMNASFTLRLSIPFCRKSYTMKHGSLQAGKADRRPEAGGIDLVLRSTVCGLQPFSCPVNGNGKRLHRRDAEEAENAPACRGYFTITCRTRRAARRSSSTSTPMPGPVGTVMVLSSRFSESISGYMFSLCSESVIKPERTRIAGILLPTVSIYTRILRQRVFFRKNSNPMIITVRSENSEAMR